MPEYNPSGGFDAWAQANELNSRERAQREAAALQREHMRQQAAEFAKTMELHQQQFGLQRQAEQRAQEMFLANLLSNPNLSQQAPTLPTMIPSATSGVQPGPSIPLSKEPPLNLAGRNFSVIPHEILNARAQQETLALEEKKQNLGLQGKLKDIEQTTNLTEKLKGAKLDEYVGLLTKDPEKQANIKAMYHLLGKIPDDPRAILAFKMLPDLANLGGPGKAFEALDAFEKILARFPRSMKEGAEWATVGNRNALLSAETEGARQNVSMNRARMAGEGYYGNTLRAIQSNPATANADMTEKHRLASEMLNKVQPEQGLSPSEHQAAIGYAMEKLRSWLPNEKETGILKTVHDVQKLGQERGGKPQQVPIKPIPATIPTPITVQPAIPTSHPIAQLPSDIVPPKPQTPTISPEFAQQAEQIFSNPTGPARDIFDFFNRLIKPSMSPEAQKRLKDAQKVNELLYGGSPINYPDWMR